MKQIGLLILAILFTVVQSPAQKKTDKVDMVFDKTVNGSTFHDFGSIVYGANGKVDFTFTNKGNKPLVISEVKSSCGCTIPTWTKEPVEPGKQGTVTVEYNTKLPGVFNKTVVVTSNANNSPVRLEIRGKINAQASDLKPGNSATDKNAVNPNLKEVNYTGIAADSTDPFAKKAAIQKANEEARKATVSTATPVKQTTKKATKK
jgi:hypothetical protein